MKTSSIKAKKPVYTCVMKLQTLELRIKLWNKKKTYKNECPGKDLNA